MYSRTKTGVYMNRNYQNNGYLETIQNGLSGVRSFREGISYGSGSREERIVKLRKEINEADAILIGVGSGLSTSAGLTYSGERFERYFYDFVQRYGITDMYSGGFYPFEMTRLTGRGGADISITTAISMNRNRYIKIF